MTTSCRKATQLISAAMDRRLSFSENVALRFHLVICASCQRYRRQLALIRAAVRRHLLRVDDVIDSAAQMLSPQARQRIKQEIQKGT